MSETMICPSCNASIYHLKYNCSYQEWGYEYGTCSIYGEDYEEDNRERNDGETNEYEHRCPECNEVVDTIDYGYEGDHGMNAYNPTSTESADSFNKNQLKNI